MKGMFADKTALVTGAGSGIGRACAQAFAREGANVVVADYDAAGGEETASIIRKAGGTAAFYKADVSKEAEVEALLQFTLDTYGRLDCAHNNAGVDQRPPAPLSSVTEQEWDRVISINLKGVFVCMKHEIIAMQKQGSGAIVNTSSMRGLTSARNMAVYSASKHGVLGLTKSAALEVADQGIRVNAVCPGFIETPLSRKTQQEHPALVQGIIDSIPMKRAGVPADIAEAVLWLCSDASSYITGHSLVIDGGRIA